MIYINFTPSGSSTTYHISTEDSAEDIQWYGWVTSIDSLKLSLPTRHGGLVRPEFSTLTVSPDFILELGTIVEEATVEILEDTTKLYTGTARLEEYDRHSFTYNLYKPDLADKVTSGTAYADTLVNVVSSMCTTLGLTLNSTYAESPSPAVSHTVDSDTLITDLLSGMCSFFSHGARIIDTTLYLYDMLGASYSINVLTEFDITNVIHRKDKAYSLYKAGDTESLAGSVDNGDEYIVTPYHGTGDNIQTSLARIKTIMEQDIAQITWKSDSSKPVITEKLSIVDESVVLPVYFCGIVTSVIYNYQTLGVEVEASGITTII